MMYGSPPVTAQRPAADYTPPAKTKRYPIPTIAQMQEESTRVRALFQLRNEIILIGRQVVQLASIVAQSSGSRRTSTKADDDLMRLSWPDTVLQEVVATLGRLDEDITMAASDPTEQAEHDAARPVAFLNRLVDQLNDEYQAGGGPTSLQESIAQYAARDGQVYERWCRRNTDDPKLPVWDFELIDPLEMYPVWEGGRMVRCYRITTMKVGDIRAQWGDVPALADIEDSEDREIVARYDGYWHCVMLGNDWLKTPKPHDYKWGIPIIATFFRGWVGSAGYHGSLSPSEVEAYRGRGILWSVLDELRMIAKLWSALIDRVMRTTRAPLTRTATSEVLNSDPAEVQDWPGGVTELKAGESIGLLPQMTGDLAYINTLAPALQGALESGTISLNTAQKFASGYDRHISEKQGATFYSPFTKGMRSHYRRRYRVALLLFKQFGVTTQVKGMSPRGKPYLWPFTPDMVPEDPEIDVTFDDASSMDRVSTLGALAPAMAAGFIDEEEAYGPNFLKLPNAALLAQRVRQSRMLNNPQAQAILLPGQMIMALEQAIRDANERGQELTAWVLTNQLHDLILKTIGPKPPFPTPDSQDPNSQPAPEQPMQLGAGPMPGMGGPMGPEQGIPMPPSSALPATQAMGSSDQPVQDFAGRGAF